MKTTLVRNFEAVFGAVCKEAQIWLDNNSKYDLDDVWEHNGNPEWMLYGLEAWSKLYNTSLSRYKLPSDPYRVIQQAIRYLPDKCLDVQVGPMTLRKVLIDTVGEQKVELALSGMSYYDASQALDRQRLPEVFDVLDLYQDGARRLFSFEELTDLLSFFWSIFDKLGVSKQIIKLGLEGLATYIFEKIPRCPLWILTANFYVIFSVDVPKGQGLTQYVPPYFSNFWRVTDSNDKSSEYSYLDDDNEDTWAKGKHRTYVASELPLWAFKAWIEKSGMVFETENTMGSLTELGRLPAIAFYAPDERDSITSAYVTPLFYVKDKLEADERYQEMVAWLKYVSHAPAR